MSENRTLDITPTPRATAIVCIAILKKYIPTQKDGACDRITHIVSPEPDARWAEEQILKMIIEDWPEDDA